MRPFLIISLIIIIISLIIIITLIIIIIIMDLFLQEKIILNVYACGYTHPDMHVRSRMCVCVHKHSNTYMLTFTGAQSFFLSWLTGNTI